ncbi:MAG: orotate phosphoribosyltransferase, partial [Rectinema sp.]|nr:orotate phosphoribosyltransferase [Rectinema sp.]
LDADAVTLNPYMGLDTLEPFLEWEDRGVFVLCRTSNPGAGFLQDVSVDGSHLYVRVAEACAGLSAEQVGLVVAGNDTEALRRARMAAPALWFLSPGIGAQGGKADEAFDAGARDDGMGVLVVAARSVAESEDPHAAARELRDALRRARDRRCAPSRKKIAVQHPSSTPDSPLERDFVNSLIATGCFRLGEFTLKSGKKSPFYIDLRKLIADPAAMKIAGKAYASLAKACTFDRIAGIPAAGLPLATVASLEIGSPMVWPRMPVKEHGTGNRIEGSFSKGDRILLLDDLITTGASKLEALAILRSEGLVVEDLVVLIERGKQGRQDMERAGIRLHAFIHVERLFGVLLENGIIDAIQHEALVRYVKEE